VKINRNVIRLFSSFDERHPTNVFPDPEATTSAETFEWPDTRLGPLEPTDRRFPLPGLVGSMDFQQKQATHPVEPLTVRRVLQYDVDILVAELPHERQSTIFEQFITVNKQLQPAEQMSNKPSAESSENTSSSPFDRLECVAYDCPFLLRKDFFDLFPNCQLYKSQSLTVITICQRTVVDKKLEQEDGSTALIDDFLLAATDLCQVLHTAGYWADFIDPTSGRPYLSSHTVANVYEVDERYRHFGFEIEDGVAGGQCRVLRHHALGSRPFIGCVFTSAPSSHPVIASLSLTHSKSSSSSSNI
jgi:hypothetical protein